MQPPEALLRRLLACTKRAFLGPAKPALDRRWTSPYSPVHPHIITNTEYGGHFRGATRTGGGDRLGGPAHPASPAARRMTARTLAEQTGFSPSYISQMERGLLSPSLITALSKVAARWTSPSRVLSDVPHHGGGRPARWSGPRRAPAYPC